LAVFIAATQERYTGFAVGPIANGGLVVAYGAAITSLGLVSSALPETTERR
jgi:hypothetical protein